MAVMMLNHLVRLWYQSENLSFLNFAIIALSLLSPSSRLFIFPVIFTLALVLASYVAILAFVFHMDEL